MATQSPLPQQDTLNPKEKELELLGKEYDAMRTEIVAREGSRIQLTLATLALLTISGTLVPLFLSGSSNILQGSQVSYVIAGLLIIAFLFITLSWTYYQQDQEVGFLAKRIQTIRKRICDLLLLNRDTSEIFGYDKEHIKMLWPRGIGIIFTAMLTISRYLTVIIPAAIALSLAILVHINSFPKLIGPQSNTYLIIGEIVDVVYLLLNIAATIYAIAFYKTLEQ